jgi:hypothetical protein
MNSTQYQTRKRLKRIEKHRITSILETTTRDKRHLTMLRMRSLPARHQASGLDGGKVARRGFRVTAEEVELTAKRRTGFNQEESQACRTRAQYVVFSGVEVRRVGLWLLEEADKRRSQPKSWTYYVGEVMRVFNVAVCLLGPRAPQWLQSR